MVDPIALLRDEGWKPAKLARALKDITPQAISQWKQVPAERVIEVEAVTGISRHVLRSDLSRIFVSNQPDEAA